MRALARLPLLIWLLPWWQSTAMADQERTPMIERLATWLMPELRELRSDETCIDMELKGLPDPAGINTSNRNGFQTSGAAKDGDLWVEVELGEEAAIDTVVLVPALTKGAEGGIAGFGFPRRFLLEVIDNEGESQVLMDETAVDFPNPGLTPVIAAVPEETRVRRIRLTATKPWEAGGSQTLALSELLALKGNRNLAFRAKVHSPDSREIPPTWSRYNLVDMATPLGLPVKPTTGGVHGWRTEAGKDPAARKQVAVDLAKAVPIDEIRLVPASQKGLPRAFEYGLPARFRIEISPTAQGDVWQTIYDRTDRSLQTPGANVQCFSADQALARRVRVSATRLRDWAGDHVFALGELQVYAGDLNLAPSAQVLADESVENANWGSAGLIDGMVADGRLIELPQWFEGLKRRQELVEKRALVRERHGKLLRRAEHLLMGSSIGITCGVAVLAGVVSWRGRRQRRLELLHHRERLARDLHDELGSNLGSIALISSFARQGGEDPQEIRSDLHEIERVARESIDAMRDMVGLLENKHGTPGYDWLKMLHGLAERHLRGIQVETNLPNVHLIREPDYQTRRDIHLFCKEVLFNIAHHARATKVRFHLESTRDGLDIEISDDGRGFDPEVPTSGHGLANLHKRAESLRACLDLSSRPGGGTLVSLHVPRGKRWRKPASRNR